MTDLGFRQITDRIICTDPKNRNDDHGTVVLPVDPGLLEMAQRILDEALESSAGHW